VVWLFPNAKDVRDCGCNGLLTPYSNNQQSLFLQLEQQSRIDYELTVLPLAQGNKLMMIFCFHRTDCFGQAGGQCVGNNILQFYIVMTVNNCNRLPVSILFYLPEPKNTVTFNVVRLYVPVITVELWNFKDEKDRNSHSAQRKKKRKGFWCETHTVVYHTILVLWLTVTVSFLPGRENNMFHHRYKDMGESSRLRWPEYDRVA
jgi:hypothetical protein